MIRNPFKSIRFPQLVILIFLGLMSAMAIWLEIPFSWIINDALVRLVMNGVLVLSLIPMLNAGIGINFGLPIGITAGLLGMCVAVNFKLTGFSGFMGALFLTVLPGILLGYIFAKILNCVKGKEEITATFAGFALIPLMNFFWAKAPFSNPVMLWPIGGKGLRPTIGLKSYFAKTLNTLFAVNIGEITIPFGLLLFFAILCGTISYFFKTRIGRVMIAVGENETYARLNGIDILKIRTIAVVLSTVVAGLGICVYAQSYGFLELYDAPLMMAFPAASAILVGGSLGRRTSVMHVLLGTFLFQTTYLISGPIANDLLIPEAAEILRLLFTNSIILYALLYEGHRHS